MQHSVSAAARRHPREEDRYRHRHHEHSKKHSGSSRKYKRSRHHSSSSSSSSSSGNHSLDYSDSQSYSESDDSTSSSSNNDERYRSTRSKRRHRQYHERKRKHKGSTSRNHKSSTNRRGRERHRRDYDERSSSSATTSSRRRNHGDRTNKQRKASKSHNNTKKNKSTRSSSRGRRPEPHPHRSLTPSRRTRRRRTRPRSSTATHASNHPRRATSSPPNNYDRPRRSVMMDEPFVSSYQTHHSEQQQPSSWPYPPQSTYSPYYAAPPPWMTMMPPPQPYSPYHYPPVQAEAVRAESVVLMEENNDNNNDDDHHHLEEENDYQQDDDVDAPSDTTTSADSTPHQAAVVDQQPLAASVANEAADNHEQAPETATTRRTGDVFTDNSSDQHLALEHPRNSSSSSSSSSSSDDSDASRSDAADEPQPSSSRPVLQVLLQKARDPRGSSWTAAGDRGGSTANQPVTPREQQQPPPPTVSKYSWNDQDAFNIVEHLQRVSSQPKTNHGFSSQYLNPLAAWWSERRRFFKRTVTGAAALDQYPQLFALGILSKRYMTSKDPCTSRHDSHYDFYDNLIKPLVPLPKTYAELVQWRHPNATNHQVPQLTEESFPSARRGPQEELRHHQEPLRHHQFPRSNSSGQYGDANNVEIQEESAAQQSMIRRQTSFHREEPDDASIASGPSKPLRSGRLSPANLRQYPSSWTSSRVGLPPRPTDASTTPPAHVPSQLPHNLDIPSLRPQETTTPESQWQQPYPQQHPASWHYSHVPPSMVPAWSPYAPHQGNSSQPQANPNSNTSLPYYPPPSPFSPFSAYYSPFHLPPWFFGGWPPAGLPGAALYATQSLPTTPSDRVHPPTAAAAVPHRAPPEILVRKHKRPRSSRTGQDPPDRTSAEHLQESVTWANGPLPQQQPSVVVDRGTVMDDSVKKQAHQAMSSTALPTMNAALPAPKVESLVPPPPLVETLQRNAALHQNMRLRGPSIVGGVQQHDVQDQTIGGGVHSTRPTVVPPSHAPDTDSVYQVDEKRHVHIAPGFPADETPSADSSVVGPDAVYIPVTFIDEDDLLDADVGPKPLGGDFDSNSDDRSLEIADPAKNSYSSTMSQPGPQSIAMVRSAPEPQHINPEESSECSEAMSDTEFSVPSKRQGYIDPPFLSILSIRFASSNLARRPRSAALPAPPAIFTAKEVQAARSCIQKKLPVFVASKQEPASGGVTEKRDNHAAWRLETSKLKDAFMERKPQSQSIVSSASSDEVFVQGGSQSHLTSALQQARQDSVRSFGSTRLNLRSRPGGAAYAVPSPKQASPSPVRTSKLNIHIVKLGGPTPPFEDQSENKVAESMSKLGGLSRTSDEKAVLARAHDQDSLSLVGHRVADTVLVDNGDVSSVTSMGESENPFGGGVFGNDGVPDATETSRAAETTSVTSRSLAPIGNQPEATTEPQPPQPSMMETKLTLRRGNPAPLHADDQPDSPVSPAVPVRTKRLQLKTTRLGEPPEPQLIHSQPELQPVEIPTDAPPFIQSTKLRLGNARHVDLADFSETRPPSSPSRLGDPPAREAAERHEEENIAQESPENEDMDENNSVRSASNISPPPPVRKGKLNLTIKRLGEAPAPVPATAVPDPVPPTPFSAEMENEVEIEVVSEEFIEEESVTSASLTPPVRTKKLNLTVTRLGATPPDPPLVIAETTSPRETAHFIEVEAEVSESEVEEETVEDSEVEEEIVEDSEVQIEEEVMESEESSQSGTPPVRKGKVQVAVTRLGATPVTTPIDRSENQNEAEEIVVDEIAEDSVSSRSSSCSSSLVSSRSSSRSSSPEPPPRRTGKLNLSITKVGSAAGESVPLQTSSVPAKKLDMKITKLWSPEKPKLGEPRLVEKVAATEKTEGLATFIGTSNHKKVVSGKSVSSGSFSQGMDISVSEVFASDALAQAGKVVQQPDRSDHAKPHKISEQFEDYDSAYFALTNFISFKKQPKMKQATLTLIATLLLEDEEKSKLDEVFDALDRTQTGVLSRGDIRHGYNEFLGITDVDKAEIETLFSEKAEHVDYSDFVIGAMDKSAMLGSEALQRAFNILDSDRSGFISADELKAVLPSADKTINKIIAKVDFDGDGQISFGEFLSMVFKSANAKSSQDRTGRSERTAHALNSDADAPAPTPSFQQDDAMIVEENSGKAASDQNDLSSKLAKNAQLHKKMRLRGPSIIGDVPPQQPSVESMELVPDIKKPTKEEPPKPKPIPKSNLYKFESLPQAEVDPLQQQQQQQPKAIPQHILDEIKAAEREKDPEMLKKLEAALHLGPPPATGYKEGQYLTTRPDSAYRDEVTDDDLKAKPLPMNLLGELQSAQTDLTKILHKGREHKPEVGMVGGKVPAMPFLNELKSAQQDLKKVLTVVPEEEKNRKAIQKPRPYVDELRKAQATVLKQWREDTYDYWI